jgi:HK97 family phage major capsid protein
MVFNMEEKVLAKLDEMSAKANENKVAVEKSITEQVATVKTEVTAVTDGLKSEIKVVKDAADKAVEIATELSKKAGRISAPSGDNGPSFKDALGESLEQQKDALKNYSSKREAIQLKVVGNMAATSLTTTGTQTWAGEQRIGGIGRKPYELQHIRDFVNVQAISSDAAYVIRDAAGEGGPVAVAMGIAKPQSDRDYVKVIQPVTKIAHYFKIPEEMLADLPWLQNEITAIGVEDLLAKEDDLLLNQVGAAGLFAGLTTATNSTAYSTPASLALAIDLANNYDVLVAAWTQLKVLKNNANLILCNPADYARMILTKSSTTIGEYVFGAPNVSIPNVFGIPLVPHNSITSDKFLIGDFSKVNLGQRAGISVRFYDQNEDDAIKNMVTVVIEERVTILADRADRIIYGDFSDARAALETA